MQEGVGLVGVCLRVVAAWAVEAAAVASACALRLRLQALHEIMVMTLPVLMRKGQGQNRGTTGVHVTSE